MEKKLLNKIKACFFDLYDTIIYLDPDKFIEKQLQCSILLGIDFEKYNHLWKSSTIKSNLGFYKTTQDRIKALGDSIGIKLKKLQIEKVTEIEHHFLRSSIIIYKNSKTVLSTIREMGIKTALISNASISVIEVMKATQLNEYFDHTTFSFKIGFRKPDPEIYSDALDNLTVPAENVIFIGDGNDGELDGAKKLGMTTVKIKNIAFNNISSFQSNFKYIDYYIENLTEILDIVSKFNQK